MKHYLTALGLATAMSVMATPAQAATTVTYPAGQNIALTASPDGQTYVGAFTGKVAGTGVFTSSFTFTVPAAGLVSIAGISILSSPQSNIDFMSGLLDGTVPFTISNGFVDVADISLKAIGVGQHTFTLNGLLNPPSGNGNAGFGGNVSFALAAVPEPATWALFILGFASLGGVMRRKASRSRSLKAAIHFA